MLVRAGSKLFIVGEYAILKENALAIVAFINKYTYLNIFKNNTDIINTSIVDKDEYILKCINFVRNKFNIKNNYIMNFETELYNKEKIKYGLGSSASLIICIIKGILNIENIRHSKKDIFDIAVEFCLENKIKGSYGDLACISFEKNIIFTSSNPIKKKYKIKKLKYNNSYHIKAIWTKKSASSKNLIKNVNINNPIFLEFYEKSNTLIKKFLKTENIDIIKELDENLKFLDKNLKIGIFNDYINSYLEKYDFSKISGAGAGDFIITFNNGYRKNLIEI